MSNVHYLPPRRKSKVRPPEIEDLQEIMRGIDEQVDLLSLPLTEIQTRLVPNALLNLAVERMLRGESNQAVAQILHRLADLIDGGAQPRKDELIALSDDEK